MSSSLDSNKPVAEKWRRHVFFLNGFDPKGASHYYALYQAELLKQNTLNGLRAKAGPRLRDEDGNSSWTIAARPLEGPECEVTYEFLRWDDIVRQYWPRTGWRLLLDLFSAYLLMLRSGGIPTVWKLSRKTLVGLAYPLVVLGGGLLLGILLSVGEASLLRRTGSGWPLAITSGVALLGLVLWGTRKLENRLTTTWLIRIFSFVAKQARGQIPSLEQRMDSVARRLAQKLSDRDLDEILVVGFSVGSLLAVSVTARALDMVRTPSESDRRPALSLLTLGHCIPMLGLLPQAGIFRQELATLAQAKSLHWMDFSSPTDWGSFALVNPVTASGALPAGVSAPNPVMRSPRFHTQFHPTQYLQLRRNKKRMHMQYLMAGELASSYDYFAITAGGLTLAQRYDVPAAPAGDAVRS